MAKLETGPKTPNTPSNSAETRTATMKSSQKVKKSARAPMCRRVRMAAVVKPSSTKQADASGIIPAPAQAAVTLNKAGAECATCPANTSAEQMATRMAIPIESIWIRLP